MAEKNLSAKEADFIDAALAAFNKEIIKKIVFSRPHSSEITKVSGRLCRGKRGNVLSLEYSLPCNTVSHKNLSGEELRRELGELILSYGQANLITTAGDIEWKISSSGKEALLGLDKLKRRLSGDAPAFEKAIEALDNKKSYILRGDEDFLIKLGVSDRSGRVHDKKQGKFRQINRFLEHIEDIFGVFPEKGEIKIYDLCCGKSYLSFAVYYYLTEVKKRQVKMLCIDLKRDVIAHCDALAKEMGFVGMKFITDDVRNTPEGESPDMVISLHACDLATDVVLDTAISLGAKVILSTPCCHRYLNNKINSEELGFVTKYPHLKNKLAEALTDAIRAARLYSNGYAVTVPELTDPDDTPKNTLIRAIRSDNISKTVLEERQAEYEKILSFVLGNGAKNYLSEIKRCSIT